MPKFMEYVEIAAEVFSTLIFVAVALAGVLFALAVWNGIVL